MFRNAVQVCGVLCYCFATAL